MTGRPSSSTCSGASLARGTSTGTAPTVTGARPPWPVSCTSGGFSAAARSRTCGRCRPPGSRPPACGPATAPRCASTTRRSGPGGRPGSTRSTGASDASSAGRRTVASCWTGSTTTRRNAGASATSRRTPSAGPAGYPRTAAAPGALTSRCSSAAGTMADARAAFLDAASTAVQLLERRELTERWQQDSVLPQFAVAALAGHLLRGMTTVEQYLDGPEPDGAGISADRYFHTVIRSADIDDPAHQAIRGRGAEAAAGGPAALASEARAALGRLSPRLAEMHAGRRLRVAGGLVMTLDEYLRTRVVELVVHADDLAASLGVELAPPQPATCTIAIDVLVGVARIRHGDMAVLRALARRERDQVQALRVL